MKFAKKWKVVPYDENMETEHIKEQQLKKDFESKNEDILQNNTLEITDKFNLYNNNLNKYLDKKQTSKNVATKTEPFVSETKFEDLKNQIANLKLKSNNNNSKNHNELKKIVADLQKRSNVEIAKIYNQLNQFYEENGIQNNHETTFQKAPALGTRNKKSKRAKPSDELGFDGPVDLNFNPSNITTRKVKSGIFDEVNNNKNLQMRLNKKTDFTNNDAQKAQNESIVESMDTMPSWEFTNKANNIDMDNLSKNLEKSFK